MPRYCFIERCRNTSYKNPNRKLIRFPKNTKTFLCDQHFPSTFFGKKKLKESSYDKIESILKEKGISVPLEPLAEKIMKNKRKYSRRCVISHCQLTDTSTTPPVRFVIFPKKDSKLYDVWVKKCNLSTADGAKACKYVCEKHFSDTSDRVPNCNLTSTKLKAKRTRQLSKFIQGDTKENVTTDESQADRCQPNSEVARIFSPLINPNSFLLFLVAVAEEQFNFNIYCNVDGRLLWP